MHAVHVIDEAFRCRAFGKEQLMGGKFHMIICELLRHARIADEADPVHQRTSLDEHAANEQRVIRPDQ